MSPQEKTVMLAALLLALLVLAKVGVMAIRSYLRRTR